MELLFKKLKSKVASPPAGRNVAYLSEDAWDDYHFKTTFYLRVFDEQGLLHDIGSVKIGIVGMVNGWTSEKLPLEFSCFTEAAFSLGGDEQYYKNIRDKLSEELGTLVLRSLNDVAFSSENLKVAKEQQVFKTSLLRSVSLSAISGQFSRILKYQAPLTEFKFSYKKVKSELNAKVELKFEVVPGSIPSSNIHVLIGRNGVGKTTLLNNIVKSIIEDAADKSEVGVLLQKENIFQEAELPKDYFSSISSVSFSAFDPFIPPKNRPDRSLGTCYFYIGLKKNEDADKNELKDIERLRQDFLKSLFVCFSIDSKKQRWLNAIKTLESDDNFAEMDLCRLGTIKQPNEVAKQAYNLVKRMSSGHTIVLLTITNLIETIEEKTLVLIDEPESHLHPPLLSAFTRSLSDLLVDRNAVAIIATHSPVVLQEVPRNCVWKLERTRNEGKSFRPESETFGENVGVLTREVFGLEVNKSGFHALLIDSVNKGKTYEEIIELYQAQLGFEGKAILRALLANFRNVKDDNESN